MTTPPHTLTLTETDKIEMAAQDGVAMGDHYEDILWGMRETLVDERESMGVDPAVTDTEFAYMGEFLRSLA